MLIRIDGELRPGVTSKDIILHVCKVIGTAGGTGATIKFAGDAISKLSMEARMSISNMAIEAAARAEIRDERPRKIGKRKYAAHVDLAQHVSVDAGCVLPGPT